MSWRSRYSRDCAAHAQAVGGLLEVQTRSSLLALGDVVEEAVDDQARWPLTARRASTWRVTISSLRAMS
jgi:hypothetical protein